MLVFDLTVQYIFAFFLLVYTANFINFLGYNVLIRRVKTIEGNLLHQRTNTYFYFMIVLYALNFAAAYSSFYGPWCTQNNLYPPCMTAAAFLYWINYFYHIYLDRSNYFLKWELAPNTSLAVEQESERLKRKRDLFVA